MTQAYNLSQLANNLNSVGQLDATDGLVNAVPLANGGTGASTQSAARTNLGLGTIATQSASNVSITGGSITGITDLAVADGGTGASTLSGVVYGNGTSAFTAATGAQIVSAIGTTSVTNATNATTATNVTNAVGNGQTWQNFSSPTRQTDSSFTWSTITNKYTNSTGKPIMVSVGRFGGDGYATTVWVDGIAVLAAQVDRYGGTASMGAIIVPDGSQYAVSVSSGTWCNYWVELR